MFASQLSRLLQTLPADDICSAFDSTEEKTKLKENQPEIICIADGKEADCDCSLKSIENKSEGDDENEVFRFIAQKMGGDTLASDTKDSPEFESYMIVNPTDVSRLCSDDKSELPKLIVCYQESKYYPVRDIDTKFDSDANECTNKEGEDTTLPVHDCPKVNIAANDTFLEDLVKLFGSKCSQQENLEGHTVDADGEALPSITIPYSGSISLRSDSSTTSATSFAFPILQSEWNSSPVQMKKADRRLHKHRGWRQGLLCCRF